MHTIGLVVPMREPMTPLTGSAGGGGAAAGSEDGLRRLWKQLLQMVRGAAIDSAIPTTRPKLSRGFNPSVLTTATRAQRRQRATA